MQSPAGDSASKTRHLVQKSDQNTVRQKNENALDAAAPAMRRQDRLQMLERLLGDDEHDPQNGGGKKWDQGKIKKLAQVMREDLACRFKKQEESKEWGHAEQNTQSNFGHDDEIQRVTDGDDRHVKHAIAHNKKSQGAQPRGFVDFIRGQYSPFKNVG